MHTPSTDSGVSKPSIETRREEVAPRKRTYGQILKSSAWIGGSSVVNIAVGIVRTKAMATLLGPAGFGLMGMYDALASLVRTVASLGINSSGVRQIAEAVGSREEERVAMTVTVLRRIAVVLGVLGAVFLLVFCRPLSKLTFGNEDYGWPIALLSLAVLFRTISDGQGALIQGMRRIADLAKSSVLGTVLGTLLSIPLVYFLREEGVVPALIAVAITSLLLSWWYSRKVKIKVPHMTGSQMGREVKGLLKLGFAFMACGLMTMGAAYVVRTFVLRAVGIEAAGLYQSAWTLGGLYIGFILQAMGADFYPRLTAAANDHSECNHLVNEQAEISLLLAGPGVLATLTFASLVITLLYTPEFIAAVELLRWICLGMTLRVISWPMGFILLAKGKQGLFFWTDVAWTIVHIGLSWGCIMTFGLNGAGVAFFGSYVFHVFLIYPIVRRLTGFRWSSANTRIGLIYVPIIGLVFLGFAVLPHVLATGVGALACMVTGIYSVRVLCKLVPLERIPAPLRRLLVWFRFYDRPATAPEEKMEDK